MHTGARGLFDLIMFSAFIICLSLVMQSDSTAVMMIGKGVQCPRSLITISPRQRFMKCWADDCHEEHELPEEVQGWLEYVLRFYDLIPPYKILVSLSVFL